MAKKIIILERVNAPSDYSFRYCLWAENPSARKGHHANPNFVSSFSGISAEELEALRTGAVIEETGFAQFKDGTSLDSIQNELQKRFDIFQQNVIEQNKLSLYGTFLDENGWTEGGVA